MYFVSRKVTFAKLFIILSFSGMIMYVMLGLYSFRTVFLSMSKPKETQEALIKDQPDKQLQRFDNDLKYILLWTTCEQIKHHVGQQLFITNNCSHINCYLTKNKDLLNKDVRNFEAIVFGTEALEKWRIIIPTKRSPKQKYVFYSMIPAEKYPVCNVMADNFFNWTWSYRLDSDIVTPYVEVRDLTGKIILPKSEIVDTIEGIDDTFDDRAFSVSPKDIIQVVNKKKALMWYIEECDHNGKAISYARKLKKALQEHALVMDIYGCSFNLCPNMDCTKALERDYYFYLAHEESFAVDYVTTKVLAAYHNNAVPIVVGGADYNKFLPLHSYINTVNKSIEQLASLIHHIIKTPGAYNKYFTWKKHFTIHDTNPQKGYCDLCSMLNEKKKVETSKSYAYFRKWWFYGSLNDKCY